jgi:hypothetical protein
MRFILRRKAPRLLSSDYKRFVSDSHIYVFVSIKEGGVPAEFFIIPSTVGAKKA